MEIKYKSYFKDEKKDHAYFEDWVAQLERVNGRTFERHVIATSLGRTHVWNLDTKDETLETLVVFPGARTTPLIWDFDRGLDNLNLPLKIYLVETNGLPNPSDGATPDIKSLDFGHWAAEVLEGLEIDKAFVAGASFGGLICMKLGIVHPEKVKAAFLLNPGCLQSFSLSFQNLYYNLLPIVRPTPKNILKFLNKAVFCKPDHALSPQAEQMLVDYELFAISRYKDNTQKPYYMDEQLANVKVDTYLLVGDKDLLFPYQKSIDNAKKHLKTLKEIKVFNNVAHGIETYGRAMQYIGEKIKSHGKAF
ncbi:MAG: alpha/beta hydrolase [Cytophagales bacterium]|jgi:pimeloyl-ACP methyl ester carboxylesterase|nr:alpha/beta hydrolase [Cytophagales bacterium]